jgi:hypothetical protein
LEPFERYFEGSEGMIYEQIETDMFLYEIENRRKQHRHAYQEHDLAEDFSIWRAVSPMTHLFTTIPDELVD